MFTLNGNLQTISSYTYICKFHSILEFAQTYTNIHIIATAPSAQYH